MAKVITVENRKGGVGKTTTAVSLAVAIAKWLEVEDANEPTRKKRRVLIIDTDPQGSAANIMGLKELRGERCLSRVLLEGEHGDFKENVLSADLARQSGPSRPNLYVLPSSDRLEVAIAQIKDDLAAMREIANKMSPAMRKAQGLETIPTITDVFLRVLSPLKEYFAYIFIDCPPSLGYLREGIHKFAEFAVVPTKLLDEDVGQTSKHTKNILDDQAAGANICILAVVPTQVQANLKLSKEMMTQLQTAYGNLLVRPVPLLTGVAQAVALGGLSIFDYAPDSAAAKAYLSLAKKVMAA